MARRRGRSVQRGIKFQAKKEAPPALAAEGPFLGTMQAGPARPTRAHGLSDEHQDRGLIYVEKQIWDDAIREFQKAVELTPDFSEGLNNLGLCYVYTERFKEAIEALSEALRHFPGWHVAMANLGLAHQKAKRPKDAIKYYRQAVNKSPKQAQVWAALGECLEGCGKGDEAMGAYREAIKLAPKYGLPLHRLGMLLARKMELDEAEVILKDALEQNSELADAASVLGAIAARRGQLSAARDYFEQAKVARPEKVPAAASRGMAAIEAYEEGVQRNFEELKAQYDEIPSLAECMFNAGLAQLKAGHNAQARSAFETAVSEDPKWAEPLVWLGLLEALEQGPVAGRSRLDNARKLEPENGLVCETLGLICQALGLKKEAAKHFAQAEKLGREMPEPAA